MNAVLQSVTSVDNDLSQIMNGYECDGTYIFIG